MTIRYVPIPKINPRNPNAPAKYYAAARTKGHIDLRYLAERITQMSTVTTIDTLAVLEALLTVIPQELSLGNTVKLGELGTYTLSLHSTGSDTSDEVTVQNIEEVKANFRPGRLFKRVLRDVQFEKGSLPPEEAEPPAGG